MSRRISPAIEEGVTLTEGPDLTVYTTDTWIKLMRGTLLSSLFQLPSDVFKTFMTLLLLAEPSTGIVNVGLAGISHAAVLPRDECKKALEVLLAEDPDSRNPKEGGRRLLVVPGGYLITNYLAYRNAKTASALKGNKRVQDHRARKRSGK